MDNASKALIMAGAILIAVALVSLGVYLYQSSAAKVNDAIRQGDVSQMIMLNAEIEKYKGNIKGSELSQLSKLMKADNAAQVFPTDLYLVPSSTTNPAAGTVDSNFRSSGNYTVEIVYGTGNTDGWVVGAKYSRTSTTTTPAPTTKP